MKIEQLIRKLNNTELNIQSTNDAYVRISTDIQDSIPKSFFEDLDSKKIPVLNKKDKEPVDNWVRYQHYPSNNEYRIVSLSSIYKFYNASPGDYVYIEKISLDSKVHYEIYMKNYEKICLKYSKSNKSFEILNENEVDQMNILNKKNNLSYNGQLIETGIFFSHKKKKRIDSPTESRFYRIDNLPENFYDKIKRDSFVEITVIRSKLYLEILNSWNFNTFIK